MLEIERSYGVKATHYGRLLSDLVMDSFAWELFAKRDKQGNYTSQIRGLCECEALLRVMRDTGELADRERLLRERDTGFVATNAPVAPSHGTGGRTHRETQDVMRMRQREPVSTTLVSTLKTSRSIVARARR